MWHTYYAPRSIAEALDLLARHGDRCRILAGGTDLILELERGIRKQQIIVDISHIAGLGEISMGMGRLSFGALVTHNDVVGSPEAVTHAFPLARACWLVGAPQIRNRGTIAGNLVTASPANDTITPLWAMDATVTLASRDRGERTLSFDQFFLGVRKTALDPDEMLLRIDAPILKPTERGAFLKLGLRQAQAISVVNVAATVEFDDRRPAEEDEAGGGATAAAAHPVLRGIRRVRRARIALGAVAPTILRASEAEASLAGQELGDAAIERAAELAAAAARPISDIRGSAEYRREMVRVLTHRSLRQLRDGAERLDWPEQPVLLHGRAGKRLRETTGEGRDGRAASGPPSTAAPSQPDSISLTLNGRPTTLHRIRGKTLLRALREDAGLTGAKEGCAEGECGACTVWLDGVAIMSCLEPAERAHGCEVVTVEGLAGIASHSGLHPAGASAASTSLSPGGRPVGGEDERLHPLQQAFIDTGAVQCGYCTPGILMSAANLLEEFPQPTADQIKQALTGNLCRCTGYYRILEAVERAAADGGQA